MFVMSLVCAEDTTYSELEDPVGKKCLPNVRELFTSQSRPQFRFCTPTSTGQMGQSEVVSAGADNSFDRCSGRKFRALQLVTKRNTAHAFLLIFHVSRPLRYS